MGMDVVSRNLSGSESDNAIYLFCVWRGRPDSSDHPVWLFL